MISVIVPTYQHAKTLRRCLLSLQQQTVKAIEVIVVDDGSTDDTRAIVAQFEPQMRYVYQTNQGAPCARNAGANFAHGDFLLFCDADVEARPDMLEKMADALRQHPEASFAYCGFFWNKRMFRSRPFDAQKLKQNNDIHTTSLIRRKDFPGFDPTLSRFQDWDLWLTMIERGCRGVAIDELLFRIVEVKGRKNISHWIPALFYRIPWDLIGWKPKAIAAYEKAKAVIQKKHAL